MKLKLYLVHSETDNGNDYKIFTDPAAEWAYCEAPIREAKCKEAIAILDRGAEGGDDWKDDAWYEFEQDMGNGNDFSSRNEEDVELPEPYASAPKLLELLDYASRFQYAMVSNSGFVVEVTDALIKAGIAQVAKAGKATT